MHAAVDRLSFLSNRRKGAVRLSLTKTKNSKEKQMKITTEATHREELLKKYREAAAYQIGLGGCPLNQ